jgi:hypothetical protein
MAAGLTYTPIATQTLGSNTPSVSFNSIPQTYTDLVLVSSYQMSGGSAGYDLCIQVNGDTGTNYSDTWVSSTGSGTPPSGRNINTNKFLLDAYGYPATSTSYTANVTTFLNYSNTTTYKTSLTRANSTYGTDAMVNLWRNTAAISSMLLFMSSNNLAAGSTFTLYGISAA